MRYHKYSSRRRVLATLAVVWTLALLVSVPPLLGWCTDAGRSAPAASASSKEDEQCAMTEQVGYILYSSAGSFYVPLAFMLFFYWRCAFLDAILPRN